VYTKPNNVWSLHFKLEVFIWCHVVYVPKSFNNISSLKVVLFVFKIFKMVANIKIKKIVKNSKMKRFQWKWIFTGSKTCFTILQPFRFAMAADLYILNWKSSYDVTLFMCQSLSTIFPRILIFVIFKPRDMQISSFICMFSN
jgi:hypothetical protein